MYSIEVYDCFYICIAKNDLVDTVPLAARAHLDLPGCLTNLHFHLQKKIRPEVGISDGSSIHDSKLARYLIRPQNIKLHSNSMTFIANFCYRYFYFTF